MAFTYGGWSEPIWNLYYYLLLLLLRKKPGVMCPKVESEV